MALHTTALRSISLPAFEAGAGGVGRCAFPGRLVTDVPAGHKYRSHGVHDGAGDAISVDAGFRGMISHPRSWVAKASAPLPSFLRPFARRGTRRIERTLPSQKCTDK